MDTESFQKRPDIFNNICCIAGRVFTLDFHKIRTDPAYMHGRDTDEIRVA